jgi:transcriptional regulator with XRE-family HTH domain
MSPEQCRAARGWLGWSQQELADRAHVGISTVRDFEAGRRQPIANNLDAMRQAIEGAGLRLRFGPGGNATGIEIRFDESG